ncbi:hypothetical protein TNCT_727341 [Trichonephila clavata]|uniref:Uncharacterized protein n=1 Tax=Trichonephila clavata TaxID=2740835 RepID=A0A8X6EXY7_TRICU|nr:hypothetical protein TNCT_727341 [Trichonephila clavata]
MVCVKINVVHEIIDWAFLFLFCSVQSCRDGKGLQFGPSKTLFPNVRFHYLSVAHLLVHLLFNPIRRITGRYLRDRISLTMKEIVTHFVKSAETQSIGPKDLSTFIVFRLRFCLISNAGERVREKVEERIGG